MNSYEPLSFAYPAQIPFGHPSPSYHASQRDYLKSHITGVLPFQFQDILRLSSVIDELPDGFEAPSFVHVDDVRGVGGDAYLFVPAGLARTMSRNAPGSAPCSSSPAT